MSRESSFSLDAILVPQGAEYKSVCKGLNCVAVSSPPIFPIPIGTLALKKHLEKWQQSLSLGHPQPRVLLMGLCGSLSPQYKVGDIVLYKSCIYSVASENQKTLFCDLELTAQLQNKLQKIPLSNFLSRKYENPFSPTPSSQKRVFTGVGFTSNRIISSVSEKLHLGQAYGVDVVDMEGFAALEVLSQSGIAVAMLRVISDDVNHNIPNLSGVINSDGSLQPLLLAVGLLRQPVTASRFILSAIRGLRVLQNLTTFLFTH